MFAGWFAAEHCCTGRTLRPRWKERRLMSLRFTHPRAWALVLLLATAGGGLCAANVLATTPTPPPGLTTTILAKSTFNELLLTAKTHPANLWRAEIKTHGASDLYVVDNKLAPNATTG